MDNHVSAVSKYVCYHLPYTCHHGTHIHTHPFNGPFSGTTRVGRYQKGKPIWTLLEQETVSGSSISWAICKSAPRSRQITTPAPHHWVFYRPDALPAAQPTASKHWRPTCHHGSTLQYIILHTLRLLEILIYRHYCKISAVIITQNN